MARLKDTELNENIITSLGDEGNPEAQKGTGAEVKEEVKEVKEEVKEVKALPDYVDKLLLIFNSEEKLYIGAKGEVHGANCNIKEVKENFTLYNNPYYKK